VQHGPTRPEGDRPALARLRVVPERWELVAEALFDAGASSLEERRSAAYWPGSQTAALPTPPWPGWTRPT
jgi:hypothetical protein